MCREGIVDRVRTVVLEHAVQVPGKSWKTTWKNVLYEPGYFRPRTNRWRGAPAYGHPV